MPHITPCVKILCSYIAISFPNVRGVNFWNKMEFVGRLPVNSFCGTRASISAADRLEPRNSAQTSFGGLALHECFGLGEKITEQNRVMFADGMMRLNGSQEIARNQLRSLVNQLIKRMLAVRTRLAPDDGSGAATRRMSPVW
jgi:hypothetical protein